MAIGAFLPDVMTRVVNVHWGGGGFIAINGDGNIYYLKLGGTNDEGLAWQDLGTLDFVGDDPDNFIPFPSGCSCAPGKDAAGKAISPVFVIVGGTGNTTSPGIIMASRDGKSWSRVFTFYNQTDTSRSTNIWTVVWDKEAGSFYAGGHTADQFSDSATSYAWMSETDLLFSSRDGFSWSEVGRHEVRIESVNSEPFPPWPADAAGLLDPHCSKMVLDINGYGVPDGNYGYDKTLLIQPNKKMSLNYIFGGVGYSEGTGIDVTFSGEGDPPTIPSDPGLATITSVATAGGKWIVAGGTWDPSGGRQPPFGGGASQAAILSTDADGKPVWKRIDPPGTNMIIAITGGMVGTNNARL